MRRLQLLVSQDLAKLIFSFGECSFLRCFGTQAGPAKHSASYEIRSGRAPRRLGIGCNRLEKCLGRSEISRIEIRGSCLILSVGVQQGIGVSRQSNWNVLSFGAVCEDLVLSCNPFFERRAVRAKSTNA